MSKINNFADDVGYCGMAITVAMSTIGDDSLTNDWILDTGSTIHLTNNRARIRNLGSDEKWVLVGDTKVKAVGPGEATIFPTEPTLYLQDDSGSTASYMTERTTSYIASAHAQNCAISNRQASCSIWNGTLTASLRITKARRQISRAAMTKPTRPFQILFVDIIVMNLAINGDSYALHAFDPYTKFHAIITSR